MQRWTLFSTVVLVACCCTAASLSGGASAGPARITQGRRGSVAPAGGAIRNSESWSTGASSAPRGASPGGWLRRKTAAGLPATIVLRGGYEESSHPPGWIEGLGYGAGGDWHLPGGKGYEEGFTGEEKRGVHRENIGEQDPKGGDTMEDEEEEEDDEEEEEESEDDDFLAARGMHGVRPDLGEQFEQTVGDVMGGEEGEGTMWGPGDQFMTGNEYTPGEPNEGEKADIKRRGPIGDDAGRQVTGEKKGGAKERAKSKLAEKERAVLNPMGLWMEEKGAKGALDLGGDGEEWCNTSSSQLEETVKNDLAKLRRWHIDLKKRSMEQVSAMLGEGDDDAALQLLRDTKQMVNESWEDPWYPINANPSSKPPVGFLEQEEEEGMGFLTQGPDAALGYLANVDGVSVEEIRHRYKGWSSSKMEGELAMLEDRAATVLVPSQFETIREAIRAAGATKKIAVAEGDYEWADRVEVGETDREDLGREAIRLRLTGDGVKATRLWGRWGMAPDSWGSISNVSFILQVAPRGPAALLTVMGGSVPFPWSFVDVELRCAGGLTLLGAQKSFTHLSGAVLGGIDASENGTCVYAALLLEQAHCILQATTVGYAEISGVRASADAVAVVDRCAVRSCGRCLMFSDQAKVLVRNSSFTECPGPAFDPVGGADPEDENAQATRTEMILQGCHVGGMVWPGAFRPGWLLEKGNSFAPSSGGRVGDGMGEGERFDADSDEVAQDGGFRTEVHFGDPPKAKASDADFERPLHDLLKLPFPEDEWKDASASLQNLINNMGCRWVRLAAAELNKRDEMGPLRIVTNATGFNVTCLANLAEGDSANEDTTIASWDKVWAGKEYEVAISCPACMQTVSVRSGLLGRVMCPKCKAVFPREATSEGVSLKHSTFLRKSLPAEDEAQDKGEEADIDQALEDMMGGRDLGELDPELKAILPLPGGKFALVDRRPPEKEISSANTANSSDAGGKGVAGMYLRAKDDHKEDGKPEKAGDEREGLRAEAAALFAEEGKMWDGDMRDRLAKFTATSREGGTPGETTTNTDAAKAAGAAAADAKSRAGGVSGVGGAANPANQAAAEAATERRKAANEEREAANRRAADEKAAREKAAREKAAVWLTANKKAAHQKAAYEDKEAEGPEMPPKAPDASDGMRQPQAFMPGHTSGDPVLDATLKKQGVIMTGDDRPFGMPPLPNPGKLRAARPQGAVHTESVNMGGGMGGEHGPVFEGRGGVKEPRANAAFGDEEEEESGPVAVEDEEEDEEEGPTRAAGQKKKKKEEEAGGEGGKDGADMEFDGDKVDPKLFAELTEFRDQLARGATDPEFMRQKEGENSKMERLSKFADTIDAAVNLADTKEHKGRHHSLYGPPEGEDVHSFERRLIESMWRQLADTEKFFCKAIQRRAVELSEGIESVGAEIRERFIELGNLHKELKQPDKPWQPEVQPEVRHLLKQVGLLSKEIWVYCESGAYEKGQTDEDLKHLVTRLKSLGLDSDASDTASEGDGDL